ncbi:hypothetical protein CR513_25332, partial [Mucuna pruriens]
MVIVSSFSQGSIICFSGTPTITTEKLNWKNYRAWSESVELWFLEQGFHDHLEKQEAEILEENRVPWLKLDYQLCAILWQSVNPKLLEILRSFKTCYSFWKNVEMSSLMMFNIVSLQQTNHDMVSHIAKARVAAEELKDLLVLHLDYEHVWDQILSSEQIPSMNSLVTRLFRVPTITKGDGITVENSAMVASRGRGRSGRGTRGML